MTTMFRLLSPHVTAAHKPRPLFISMLKSRPLLLVSSLLCVSLRGRLLHAMGAVHTKQGATSGDSTYKAAQVPAPKVTFTEEELRAKLTDEEYSVTQGKGAWVGALLTPQRCNWLCITRHRESLEWQVRQHQRRRCFQLRSVRC